MYSTQLFKEKITLTLHKFFQRKNKENKIVQFFFFEASITLIPKPHKDTERKENHRPISFGHDDKVTGTVNTIVVYFPLSS